MGNKVQAVEMPYVKMFPKSISYGGLLLFVVVTIVSLLYQGLAAAAPWFVSLVLFYILMGERYKASREQEITTNVLVHSYRRAVLLYNYLYKATQEDALADENKLKEIKYFLRDNKEHISMMDESLSEIDIETTVFTKENSNV